MMARCHVDQSDSDSYWLLLFTGDIVVSSGTSPFISYLANRVVFLSQSLVRWFVCQSAQYSATLFMNIHEIVELGQERSN